MRRVALWLAAVLTTTGAVQAQEPTADRYVLARPLPVVAHTDGAWVTPDRSFGYIPGRGFAAGVVGYLVGAAGGVGLSHLLAPSGERLPLRIALGALGGTAAVGPAVHFANGQRGDFGWTVGAALLTQAVVAGGVGLLYGVAKATGPEAELLAWFGVTLAIGSPLLVPLGADLASDRTGQP
ncbi:MAG: hypothetical protein AAGG50_05635 [Bacteroidota bacterium]